MSYKQIIDVQKVSTVHLCKFALRDAVFKDTIFRGFYILQSFIIALSKLSLRF